MRSLPTQLVMVASGFEPRPSGSRVWLQTVRETPNGQVGSVLRGGPCRSGEAVCGQSRVFHPEGLSHLPVDLSLQGPWRTFASRLPRVHLGTVDSASQSLAFLA